MDVVKIDVNGNMVIDTEGDPISDAINTLIFTITKHFIGDPNLWKYNFVELFPILSVEP